MSTKVWAKAKWYIGTKTTALASESAWTQIKGGRVSSGEGIGKTWGTTDDSTFEDGYRSAAKTIFDAGGLELTGKRVHTDPGQIALKAACDDPTDDLYNFMVVLNDNPGGAGDSPTSFKVRGQVQSFVIAPPNTNNIVEFKSRIKFEDDPLEVPMVDAA